MWGYSNLPKHIPVQATLDASRPFGVQVFFGKLINRLASVLCLSFQRPWMFDFDFHWFLCHYHTPKCFRYNKLTKIIHHCPKVRDVLCNVIRPSLSTENILNSPVIKLSAPDAPASIHNPIILGTSAHLRLAKTDRCLSFPNS